MAPDSVHNPYDVVGAFVVLAKFLGEQNLTESIAGLELAMKDSPAVAVPALIAGHGFGEDLLASALSVRSTVGRLNDVIHAAAIVQVLTKILEPGERIIARPSLGAGNDPSRPFDVETDRRVAEFKVAEWKGKDTMRKRGVFADLVNLAADESGRKAQLFVVGEAPIRFLRTTTVRADWALNRSGPRTRERYAERFDPEWKLSIAEFTAGPAAHVELIDLRDYLPALV